MSIENEPTEIAVPQEPRSLLSAIVQMARDPAMDVAKLDAILQMQERLERRQAEIEFSRALATLPPFRVKKNGRVELGAGKGSYAFAKFEDMDRVIAPVLFDAGFRLMFDSLPRVGDGGGLTVTGTLLHKDGHSKTASMTLALDTGPGRNNLQAMGSSLQYGKRYCTDMLLNVVREGEDNDASTAEPISDEEASELSRGLTETKSDLARFLQFMGVAAIQDIQKKDLARAKNLIAQKRQRAAT